MSQFYCKLILTLQLVRLSTNDNDNKWSHYLNASRIFTLLLIHEYRWLSTLDSYGLLKYFFHEPKVNIIFNLMIIKKKEQHINNYN